ncbi:MAG: aldo/keto reductase, partial [Alphaproteobacteria bacterium]|nr:aldo/keto reductase [Alphaproteobacteria bacterium]
YDYKPVPDGIWQKAEAIRAVCTRHGVDIRAAALQYPLRHPAVATVIPGVFSLDQLGTNIEMMQQELPVALWDDLAEENIAQKL